MLKARIKHTRSIIGQWRVSVLEMATRKVQLKFLFIVNLSVVFPECTILKLFNTIL